MTKEIEDLNKTLKAKYGRFSTTDLANWRVVWSTNQTEKIWTKFTKEGFELQQEEVRELRKYIYKDQQDLYVLERCLPVPEFVESKLVDKFSYEPVWFFKDANGNALPPALFAIEFIVDQINKQAAKVVGRKYQSEFDVDPKDVREAQEARLEKIESELFGNETDVTDALSHKEGIVVP